MPSASKVSTVLNDKVPYMTSTLRAIDWWYLLINETTKERMEVGDFISRVEENR